MAQEITNKIRSTSLIRVVEGRSSANAISANIALSELATSNTENVLTASIKGVIWSSNSVIDIVRGDDVVLSLHGSGEMRLDDFAYAISTGSNRNIEITSTNARGTVILEVSKEAVYTPALTGM
jgi:hypothetical protein